MVDPGVVPVVGVWWSSGEVVVVVVLLVECLW